MQLREAVPEDAEGIAAVSARASREAYEPIVDDESIIEIAEDPEFTAGIEDWLSEVHEHDGVVILVATVEQGVEERVEEGMEQDHSIDAAGSTGDVVGFSQCHVAPEYRSDELPAGEAYLRSLYVHPDWQGRGIGTELLEATVDRADASAVVLDVLRANDEAREFYEDRSFEYVDETTVELGGAEYETARYRREC